jgi:molybdenum cofactor guanylyltransferase
MMISAVLLAGGKSSRMGRNKAKMLFRGEPLWKNQLALLRRIQPSEILVSAQVDPPWRPPDVKFVGDEQPSRGPLGGIAATLARITTDHVLVLAIDVPFMTEAYLGGLCQQVGQGRGIVPMIADRAEPLVAVYPSEAKDEFAIALSSNDFSLQPLVRRLIKIGRVCQVEVSAGDRPLFRNLNEPKDLRV